MYLYLGVLFLYLTLVVTVVLTFLTEGKRVSVTHKEGLPFVHPNPPSPTSFGNDTSSSCRTVLTPPPDLLGVTEMSEIPLSRLVERFLFLSRGPGPL